MTDSADREANPPPRANRRKIDEIFGEILPGTTRDERDPEGSSGNDQRITNDIPPHWR